MMISSAQLWQTNSYFTAFLHRLWDFKSKFLWLNCWKSEQITEWNRSEDFNQFVNYKNDQDDLGSVLALCGWGFERSPCRSTPEDQHVGRQGCTAGRSQRPDVWCHTVQRILKLCLWNNCCKDWENQQGAKEPRGDSANAGEADWAGGRVGERDERRDTVATGKKNTEICKQLTSCVLLL